MPVKIRLMRIGATKRPFYRIVACDERKKRTGEYLDLLGTYNPLTQPKEIILKQDKIDEWIKKGAVLSDGYLRMTKQAPQRPPRKPKKEKNDKESSVISSPREAGPQTSDKTEEVKTPENQNNPETQTESETQNISKPEQSEAPVSDEFSDESDQTGTLSPSESSEEKSVEKTEPEEEKKEEEAK